MNWIYGQVGRTSPLATCTTTVTSNMATDPMKNSRNRSPLTVNWWRQLTGSGWTEVWTVHKRHQKHGRMFVQMQASKFLNRTASASSGNHVSAIHRFATWFLDGYFCRFLGRPLAVRPYAIPIVRLSVRPSDTLGICDYAFWPIETIWVSLESPNILVSDKVSLVQVGFS